MTTNYDDFYRKNRHGLGEPTGEFVEFFKAYGKVESMVLDVGCGQGRDALFIARLGHFVHAVDLSPSGIADLKKDANADKLQIDAVVADIRDFKTRRRFDVIVIDRMLHMLASIDRDTVFQKLICFSRRRGFILIADEKSNIPSFKATLQSSKWKWLTTFERRGFLFVQRE